MGWIILIFGPGVLLALLLATGWGFTLGRAKEACCACCLYPVAGLSGEHCPECGASLAGEGTSPAGARILRRPPRTVAAIGRTLLVAVPAIAIASFLTAISPRFILTAHASISSSLFTRLDISGRGIYDAPPGTEDPIVPAQIPRPNTTATLTGPARTVTLRVRDPMVRAEYDNPTGGTTRTLETLTDADVLDWMKAAGVDITTPAAMAEASTIRTTISSVVVRIGGNSTTVIEEQRRVMKPLTAALFIPATLAVWLSLLYPLRKQHWSSREAVGRATDAPPPSIVSYASARRSQAPTHTPGIPPRAPV